MRPVPAIPTEPLDLVAHLLRPYSNQKIFVVVHFTAHLKRTQLSNALDLLIRKHPILGCRLSPHHRKPAWRPHQNVNLAVVQASDFRGSTRAAIDTLIQSCSAGQSVFDVCVIRDADKDSLLVCVDHAIADAAGAKEACYQLASNYTRPTTGKNTHGQLPPRTNRSLRLVTSRLTAARKLRALVSARMPGGRWQFPGRTAVENRRVDYVVRHLPDGSVAAVKQHFAGTRITFNDILTAALFVAPDIVELAGTNRSMPVQFMVDLRRYLPVDDRRVIANLSGVEHVWIAKRASDSLMEVIQSAHHALAKVKRRDPGLGTAMLTEMAMRCGSRGLRYLLTTCMRRSSSTGMANPILSNFGVLDERQLLFDRTPISHAFMLGPCLYTPGIMLVASTYRERLTLSTGISGGFSNTTRAAKTLDGTCDNLKYLAGRRFDS